MKNIIMVFMIFFSFQHSFSQEIKVFDFVISIDEEIVKTLYNSTFVVKHESNIVSTVNVKYHPGNLSLEAKDFANLFSNPDNKVYLKFDYYEYIKGSQEIYNYEIEVGKNWFEQQYVILKIYNLEKKKYRKRLEPLSKDQNYTFDIDTSSGQVMRIRKP